MEFLKDGTFKGARSVYHWSDDMADVASNTQNFMVNKALKRFFAERTNNCPQ